MYLKPVRQANARGASSSILAVCLNTDSLLGGCPMKIQPVDHYLTVCEQVLFVYVSTLIPPRLMDQRNFITVLIVTQELEQTTFLF